MTDLSFAPILRFVMTERDWPALSKLEHLARFLPAVPCAGFEFSLNNDDRIDLQQRIRSGSELQRLKSCLQRFEQQGKIQVESPWSKLLNFCNENLLGTSIDELWLELDNTLFDELPPLSVFLRLSDTNANSEGIIGEIVRAFNLSISLQQKQALINCFTSCKSKTRISHIGLMLSRPASPFRLIVQDLSLEDILPYLERSGWKGTKHFLEERLDTLFTHIDRIRLALTVSEVIEHELGLECFLGNPNKYDPRWQSIFDWLKKKDLCNQQQYERLLSWPGFLLPTTVKSSWPDSLIVDSVLRNPAVIEWLDCRISHIKLTHYEKQLLSVKAYIGVIQILDESRLTNHNEFCQIQNKLQPKLRDAIDHAGDFILAARNQAGWWLDYEGFSEGISDEWVTAYVSHAMDESGINRMKAAVERAWYLLTMRSRAGWGWNYLQPADADSTLWALRLASRLGEMESPSAQNGLAFLRRHLKASGMSTYLPDNYSLWSSDTPINPAWYESHMCVTAVAANFTPLGDTPLIALRASQCVDGSWQGYWWKSNFYTTAHAAEALYLHGDDHDRDRFTAAADWMSQQLNATEAPFDQAMMLRLFTLQPETYSKQIKELTQKLLGSQLIDGSWQASADLSIDNAAGETLSALDNSRLLTSATVLCSLCKNYA
jgi:hypothetical protein